MGGQELSGSVQRRGSLVRDRLIGLEDMGHGRPVGTVYRLGDGQLVYVQKQR